MSTEATLPDLAEINPAALWLARFRAFCDAGLPMREARQLADEHSGLGRAEA